MADGRGVLRELAAEKVDAKLDRRRNGRRPEREPQALPPLTTAGWDPWWTWRFKSFEALEHLDAREVFLWGVILTTHARGGDDYAPCYHTRDQLGDSLGVSVRTITRYLKSLKRTALLFEVDRGEEPKSRQHRPPARWALDPYREHRWRSAVEKRLARVAEEDGQSSYWYERAVKHLDTFHKRSCNLRGRMEAELPDHQRTKRPKPKRE